MRLAKVEYTYIERDLTPDALPQRLTRTDLDLGPEGIIGVEYELQDFPIVTFGEASLLTELAASAELLLRKRRAELAAVFVATTGIVLFLLLEVVPPASS